MPMDDGSTRVFNHFLPVFQLQGLPVVAQEDLANGVGGADAVVVGHDQLKVDPLRGGQAMQQ